MKLVRTIKIKLNEHPNTFLSSITAYTNCFNHICQVGYKDNDSNGVSLHRKTYEYARQFLPAQLSCSARIKATEALKSIKKKLKKNPNIKCPESKQTSIRYDANSYNIWFDKNEATFSTIDGRKKVKIIVPEYFKQYLAWKRCSADLFIRDNKIYVHVTFEKETEDPISNNKFLGVDRGIRNIAVTSDKRFYGGNHVKRISDKYFRLRKILQSKGHSGKRHFRKISSKENRFRRDANHVISKQIVSTLEKGTTIILEKLTGIKERNIYKRKKKDRREHSSWSYFQLESFIKYKSALRGIIVDYVSARYTSQKCNKCDYIDRYNRTKQSLFSCKKCEYRVNADLNASFNIRNNYIKSYQDAKCILDRVEVTQPNVLPLTGIEQTLRIYS